MTRILILEEIAPAGLDLLKAEPSFDVQELYDEDTGKIQQALAEAEVLVVRSRTKVTAQLLESAPKLKIVGRPGTGRG